MALSESTAGGLLESDLDDLRKVVSGLDFGPPEIPVASAGRSRVVTDEELASGDHWAALAGAPGCLDDALLRRSSASSTSVLPTPCRPSSNRSSRKRIRRMPGRSCSLR